jgi:hypothetical protein
VYVAIGGTKDLSRGPQYANDIQAYYCPEPANCSGLKKTYTSTVHLQYNSRLKKGKAMFDG